MVLDIIRGIAVIGFFLSAYAYYVELKVKKNASYHAVCDIGEHASCSAAFKSEFGHMFGGISNSLAGMGYYATLVIVSYINLQWTFYLSALSFLMTLYLAYVLYFKLKNFCLVCNLIYVVNIALLILSYIVAF